MRSAGIENEATGCLRPAEAAIFLLRFENDDFFSPFVQEPGKGKAR